MSKEFNKTAMLKAIADYVDEGETLESIQYNAFNTDCWVVGTYKAVKALEQFDKQDQLYEKTNLNGIFGAIQYVKDDEELEFGQIVTDFTNPEELASVVAYINSKIITNELADKLGISLNDKLTEEQVKQLSSVEAMQALLK